MKKTIYLLLAMPMLLTSCDSDDIVMSDEAVEVRFCAELPEGVMSRAGELAVDKVVCTVFEDGKEITNLRQSITVGGSSIVYSPRLIKGRNYDVAFWAMKGSSYNVDDMTAIVRSDDSGLTEADFDAFTAHESIEVTNALEKPITLVRPLAQLNVGITSEDWNAAVNNFNMTPTTMKIATTGKNTFNALTGKAVGNDAAITYTVTVPGTDMTAKGVTYKQLAMCYIMTDAKETSTTADMTYSVYDQAGKAIRENVTV
ncbi:MAG: hypothetical protein IJZ17_01580, partial [Muribaculaceae bacterium]|nr:hypothetical protein [Muribaculaceae bacterium]